MIDACHRPMPNGWKARTTQSGREFIAGDHSIADMASWPWIITDKHQEVDLDRFPNVKRSHKALQQRPALRRGYEVGKEFGKPSGQWDKEARKHLMAQAETRRG